MISANNRNQHRFHRLFDLVDCDCFVNSIEDDDSLTRILELATGSRNNVNMRSCGQQRIMEDVSVQTVPQIDDLYIPWLLEVERKTDDFYVQLCNLNNTLYHSQNKVFETNSKACPTSGSSIIRNTHSGKSCLPNVKSKSSRYVKLPNSGEENLNHADPLQLIEDRIRSILRSVMELKNSIPKAGSGKLDKIGEQDYDVVQSKTVKETRVTKLQSSKQLVHQTTGLPVQVCKSKKSSMLSTVSESKYLERRQVHEIPKLLSHGNVKSELYSVPKTKNVVSAKNTPSGTIPQACNAQTKQTNPEVPTKATGAIPKNRQVQKSASSNTVIRTQKAKKTNLKPLWR